jgi:hypothetical protein
MQTRQGISRASDERLAAKELYDAIYHPDAQLVLFFCSSRYDLRRLGAELSERFPCPTLGCTTAGELSQSGFTEGSLIGTSICSPELAAQVRLIEPLAQFSTADADRLARSLQERRLPGSKAFGLLLIDGLSMREEQTTAYLYSQLGGIPLIGGSAGDDLAFKQTAVYAEGRFRSDAAVFCQFETTLPFRTFKAQHFQPTTEKMVITEADPDRRRVMEIDGQPAAEAYAELLHLRVDELTPAVFSRYPVILQISGECYVRSIQKCEPDGSLTFYCAIDNGLVLTIAKGVSFVDHLRDQLAELEQDLGPLELLIGCDCILRRLECQEKKIVAEVEALLRQRPFIGFSTYGEQYNAIHVNQTLTGVAIGAGR